MNNLNTQQSREQTTYRKTWRKITRNKRQIILWNKNK